MTTLPHGPLGRTGLDVTTLGYGDYTATTDLGRLLLVSEALVGQVYLVVFVALIVSRFPLPSADGDPS